MKNFLKIIFFLIILNFYSVCIAQDLSFSISPFYTFHSYNLKSSYGLQIGTEYLTLKNVSFNINGGFFSPANNVNGVFIENIPTTISWIDIIAKMYPIKSELKPYFGIGLGRFFLTRKWNHGVDHKVITGNLYDKMGYQFVSGLSLYKSLFLEIKYFILNTEMNRLVENESTSSKNIKVQLNTLLISLGFKFSLL